MVSYGGRSFSVIAPRLWGDLPNAIKQCSTVNRLKSKLKTFLFERTFSDQGFLIGVLSKGDVKSIEISM